MTKNNKQDEVKTKQEDNKNVKNNTPKKVIKNTPSKNKAKKPKVIKPYIHIDTFLQTAIPYYNLTSVQASGFRSRMNGKHYQRDEKIFVDELKKYLNIT